MKKRFIYVLCAMLALSMVACGKQATEVETEQSVAQTTEAATEAATEPAMETGVNIIPDGDFSQSNSAWGIYTESGGSATQSISGGELRVSINSAGRKSHSVQTYCGGFEMLQGAQYQFHFVVRSEVERTIDWRIQINGGDYHQYAGEEKVAIGPEPKSIDYTFYMEEPSDPAPRLCFNMGDLNEAQGLGAHVVTLDDVSLTILDVSQAQKIDLSVDDRDVNVNQIGYLPGDEKIAVVRDGVPDTGFSVVDNNNKTVFTGKLTGPYRGGGTGDTVCYADFTGIKDTGNTYKVVLEDGRESFSFWILDNLYDGLMDDVVRMFYLQRCGMELTQDYAGDFAHPACHTQKAVIYGTDKTIDVTGGWHDAGDYGRYVSAAGKAVADLLLAYENYPSAFSDNSNIPESGNGIPDVLDEARYELEWMLKMQDPVDGGVYHKATNLNFEGIAMPQDCKDTMYVILKSNTATLDFAGTMYMAARVYKDVDPAFAAKCQKAASLALPYYEAHMSDRNYVNPDDVLTGEYKDSVAADEYLWALCEAYKTTGATAIADRIKNFDYQRLDDWDGLGWATMTEYAYYAYLTADKPIDGLAFDMKKAFMDYTDEALEKTEKDVYRASITGSYPWGSNMTIANNGMLFLMAKQLTGDARYDKAARAQTHYLLGCNALSYCYVTGYGSLCPEHPHHRPSQTLGKCMGGMLVGGPNSSLEDPYAKATLQGRAAAKCYADNEQTYSCNEITIYWNSPLVYLLAGMR